MTVLIRPIACQHFAEHALGTAQWLVNYLDNNGDTSTAGNRGGQIMQFYDFARKFGD